MKLLKLESEIREVESAILDKYYDGEEDITEEETKLQLLTEELAVKLRQYVHILKNKNFEIIKEKIKGKIEELKKEMEYLDNTKQRVELALHNYVAKEEGIVQVIDDEGTTEYYLSKDFSVRRSVKEELVEKEDKQYVLPVLSYNEYAYILNTVSQSGNHELANYITNVTAKCLVTKLPEDHKAIVKSIRPTIKITKNKPKV